MQLVLWSVVICIMFCADASAQTTSVWTSWRDANEATSAALAKKNYALAEKAAKTAVILYSQEPSEFSAEVYIVLLDNAFQMVFTNTKNRRKTWKYLGPRLEYLMDRRIPLPPEFVDLGLLYSQVYLSAPVVSAQKSLLKQKAELIQRLEHVAKDTLPVTDPRVLEARYFTLMSERSFRKKRIVRREFSELLDKAISLNNTDVALRSLSSLAGLMTAIFRDHEEALELIRVKTLEIGVENIPKTRREELFMVVAAALFLDYGPDKAEAELSSIEALEAPELVYDEDGDVQLQPLKRYSPNFRNIRSKKFILLSFTVNRKGKTEQIKILSSDLTDLNEDAAIEAVEKWRYLPAFEDGKFKPVENVRVVFTVQPP
ncbi:MAG: TonB family protein [Pseudomonadota bacterium]